MDKHPDARAIDFKKTTFYNGANRTFGKIPIILMVDLNVLPYEALQKECESPIHQFVKMSLSIGIQQAAAPFGLSCISHSDRFFEAYKKQQSYRLHKNFIFEPDKMYFPEPERKLLDFLCTLSLRRTLAEHERTNELATEIIFCEDELEQLLDWMGEDMNKIQFSKQSSQLQLAADISFDIHVEKKELVYIIYIDYSKLGDFTPLTLNFKYIFLLNQNIIVKTAFEKQELFMNIFAFKNAENRVCFSIDAADKNILFQYFLEPYSKNYQITTDKIVAQECTSNRLQTKVFFDLAPEGIVSKMEFCYGDKTINPLHQLDYDRSYRNIEMENQALAELKQSGFREQGRLFILTDIDKVVALLTNPLTTLKRIAAVYYSQDFKNLSVKNIDQFGISLAQDESVIYMDIYLDDVSDEELVKILQAINQGKKYYRLRNGSILNLANADSTKLVQFIQNLAISDDNVHQGLLEIPLHCGPYIDNFVKENGIKKVTVDDRFKRMIEKIEHPDDGELKLSEPLTSILRDYQFVGVKWLQTMSGYSFGGIFADDMGLGKTVQVLAFLSAEKQAKKLSASLVVVPTSVLYNWQAEAEKFTPELNLLVIAGAKAERKSALCHWQRYDLLITTYGMLKNDLDEHQNINYKYIFIDEAQNIKNPMTINANCVKGLTCKCAFALTGTPIENRLLELWSIFDFIMPGLLFERSKFIQKYEIPIMKEANEEKRQELSAMIRPFIIRRTKTEVLDELPEKIETDYLAELTKEQMKLYAALYKEFKHELLPQLEQSGGGQNQLAILAALTRLRQVCAHPSSFMKDYQGGSGKLILAKEMIENLIASGHSILVFSQFTSVLRILLSELEDQKISTYYLDGTLKPEDRMSEIENFNSDQAAVFLISLKAGGLGLNLTKADIVIHFDPWWNPAIEEQASDRAYRFGQKKVVKVYNLLTKGTIEEKIAELKIKKKELFQNFIKSEGSLMSKLTVDEMRELFQGE
jgi:SNF2 family DNA or RNA helicase